MPGAGEISLSRGKGRSNGGLGLLGRGLFMSGAVGGLKIAPGPGGWGIETHFIPLTSPCRPCEPP